MTARELCVLRVRDANTEHTYELFWWRAEAEARVIEYVNRDRDAEDPTKDDTIETFAAADAYATDAGGHVAIERVTLPRVS